MTGPVDHRYYEVARPGTFAERVVTAARDAIYAKFLAFAHPAPGHTILDVGVSDVLSDAANVLERKYPFQNQITAVGLGHAAEFQAAFPAVRYQRVQPGHPLPFPDASFDIATSNAVLEHVGSEHAQREFVAELARVARLVFITVPHRYFPIEHHTAIPFLHWTDLTFNLACAALSKRAWSQESELKLMTRKRLAALAHQAPIAGRPVEVGTTGIPLGPFSSNLYLTIGAPPASNAEPR